MTMKGKTLKAALLAAFALATGSLYLEATGYKDFDVKDGSNILCTIDPACRPLTKGEVSLAKEVFSNAVDYKKVKIFDRPNYATFLPKKLLGFEYAAEAPNGNIYCVEQEYCSNDFSEEKNKQPLFLHEMTHVWQKHSGKDIFLKSTNDFIEANFNYLEMYSFDIYSKKKFSDFGIEQQAETVETYMRIRNRHDAEQRTERQQQAYCGTIKRYEQKIGEELPLKPFAPCK